MSGPEKEPEAGSEPLTGGKPISERIERYRADPEMSARMDAVAAALAQQQPGQADLDVEIDRLRGERDRAWAVLGWIGDGVSAAGARAAGSDDLTFEDRYRIEVLRGDIARLEAEGIDMSSRGPRDVKLLLRAYDAATAALARQPAAGSAETMPEPLRDTLAAIREGNTPDHGRLLALAETVELMHDTIEQLHRAAALARQPVNIDASNPRDGLAMVRIPSPDERSEFATVYRCWRQGAAGYRELEQKYDALLREHDHCAPAAPAPGSAELLPCAHCGSTAAPAIVDDGIEDTHYKTVRCRQFHGGCGMQTLFMDEAESIAAWNRRALARPAQEPAAWLLTDASGDRWTTLHDPRLTAFKPVPLYRAPPQDAQDAELLRRCIDEANMPMALFEAIQSRLQDAPVCDPQEHETEESLAACPICRPAPRAPLSPITDADGFTAESRKYQGDES